MESYILDWANLLLRWVHVITAMAWVGASLYFVMLDNSLEPPTDKESKDNAHPEKEVDHTALLFVFAMATFIGLGVVSRVSRLLHTPLMSLTNAISAIAIVGAIIVTGTSESTTIRIMGAVALFASMTNVVSGFLITDRMLKMFKQTRTEGK